MPPTYSLKLGKGLRDVSDETITFFLQMGVKYVVMPSRFNTKLTKRGLVPSADPGPKPGQMLRPWDAAELTKVKTHLESKGLQPLMVHLGKFPQILLNGPKRDQELENVKASIRAAGKAGIPVVEYNFTPLRASAGFGETGGRGKSRYRDFDDVRIKDLPPFDHVGTHTYEQMWERYEAFLKEVIPVAEEANVRMAVHPNDPPVVEYRGCAQPVRSLADLKRVVETVDSPSNGITIDTGVLTEMGEDAAEVIRWFGSRDRINHVHYRNIRVDTPYFKYTEVFHDEGDCDMLACMRAFHEVNYEWLLIPDHTPAFSGDTKGNQMGWAWAIGYLAALRHTAETG